MGLPFEWLEIEKNPNLIIQELENIVHLAPDWNKIEEMLGWTFFQKTIDTMLKNLLPQN